MLGHQVNEVRMAVLQVLPGARGHGVVLAISGS